MRLTSSTPPEKIRPANRFGSIYYKSSNVHVGTHSSGIPVSGIFGHLSIDVDGDDLKFLPHLLQPDETQTPTADTIKLTLSISPCGSDPQERGCEGLSNLDFTATAYKDGKHLYRFIQTIRGVEWQPFAKRMLASIQTNRSKVDPQYHSAPPLLDESKKEQGQNPVLDMKNREDKQKLKDATAFVGLFNLHVFSHPLSSS
jgi:hypothetical protein